MCVQVIYTYAAKLQRYTVATLPSFSVQTTEPLDPRGGKFVNREGYETDSKQDVASKTFPQILR